MNVDEKAKIFLKTILNILNNFFSHENITIDDGLT